MKRQFLALFLAGVMGWMGSCKPAAKPAAAAPAGLTLPTNAQPRLPTIKLYLGSREMITEMALTPDQEKCGMMFRTNMAENEGMIFALPQPMRASFWMKNCPLPLSAAYIDPEGTIVEIHDLQPQDTNEVVATANNILFVLETKQGWFQRNQVGVGTVIMTEKGSLPKTFLGR